MSAPRPARGDVASCAQWHASGQREAKAGHLKMALELFASCGSNEGCPTAIRTECVAFYGDVEKQTPTVIFAATDAQGNDITDVRVYSTDHLLARSLDGRPIALDPGIHHFRFILPTGDVFNSDILVREGEKNRVVSARLQNQPQGGSNTDAPSAPESTKEPGELPSAVAAERSSLPPAFWASAGVAVTALASWGSFALLGRSQQSKLNECSPNCTASLHDDFDAMRRNYLIADISLGVAVAASCAATWFFVVNKQSSSGSNVARISLVPLLHTPGAGLVVNTDAL